MSCHIKPNQQQQDHLNPTQTPIHMPVQMSERQYVCACVQLIVGCNQGTPARDNPQTPSNAFDPTGTLDKEFTKYTKMLVDTGLV